MDLHTFAKFNCSSIWSWWCPRQQEMRQQQEMQHPSGQITSVTREHAALHLQPGTTAGPAGQAAPGDRALRTVSLGGNRLQPADVQTRARHPCSKCRADLRSAQLWCLTSRLTRSSGNQTLNSIICSHPPTDETDGEAGGGGQAMGAGGWG